jgi:hypothetical protein
MASERDLVIVELHGRLGNQLFQYASGVGISRRRNAALRFRSTRVAPADLLLPRLVGDAYREVTPDELRRVGHVDDTTPWTRLEHRLLLHATRTRRRMQHRTPPTIAVWEQPGVYRPWVFDADLPVYVQGHLQSERYFAAVVDEVAASIRFPDGLASLPADAGTTLALSFRRGDYNSLGWALPLEYYDQAVELVTARAPVDTIVLFGDDTAFLELAANRYERSTRVVDATRLGPDPLTQLQLLAACDHCVIANSSFAWWGAWLGDHRARDGARLVVSPAEYGEGNDRLPARWLTIPTGTPTEI